LNALRTEGYVQANGRLQCWNSTGLRPTRLGALTTEGYAGKRQVPTLEQQRLTAGLGGSCCDGFEAF